jgi:hypothetical protein
MARPGHACDQAKSQLSCLCQERGAQCVAFIARDCSMDDQSTLCGSGLRLPFRSLGTDWY